MFYIFINNRYCKSLFLLFQYSILTPWCRVLLEKLTGLQLFKKFPAFHGTRRFITALTSVRHLSLSWPTQSSPYTHIPPPGDPSNIIHPAMPRFPHWSPSLQFPHQGPIHPPLLTHTSFLLGPNILLNTMFSNALSFLSSHSVNDQVSHPYKTTGKTTVLYILIFKFLDSNLKDKRFCTE